MNNQSIRINLSKDGREKKRVEVNDNLIWHHKRILMHLDRDTSHNSNNIDVGLCSILSMTRPCS